MGPVCVPAFVLPHAVSLSHRAKPLNPCGEQRPLNLTLRPQMRNIALTMSTGGAITRWLKWVVLTGILVAFLVPLAVALRFGSLWEIYQGYVSTVSNLTGLNNYLVSAASALLFVPFSMGVSMSMSWDRTRRRTGEAILLALFVVYNLGLFFGTQHAYFGFAKGETLKWYALTPDGVQLYDRAGVDPKYGVALKPVTKDVVRQLELMQRGEFKPIDPTQAAFFNPLTGEAQVWYYRDLDGSWEFYDKPGFHPRNGTRLQPMTQDLYIEWRRGEDERKRKEADAAAAEQRKRAEAEKVRQEAEAISQRQRRAAAAQARAEANAPVTTRFQPVPAEKPMEPRQSATYDSSIDTTIATWPEQAIVTVDSQQIQDETPTSVKLPAGTHTIVVSKSGYITVHDKITVGSNSHDFTFHLTPSLR